MLFDRIHGTVPNTHHHMYQDMSRTGAVRRQRKGEENTSIYRLSNGNLPKTHTDSMTETKFWTHVPLFQPPSCTLSPCLSLSLCTPTVHQAMPSSTYTDKQHMLKRVLGHTIRNKLWKLFLCDTKPESGYRREKGGLRGKRKGTKTMPGNAMMKQYSGC